MIFAGTGELSRKKIWFSIPFQYTPLSYKIILLKTWKVMEENKQYIVPESILSQIRETEPKVDPIRLSNDMKIQFEKWVCEWIEQFKIPQSEISKYIIKVSQPPLNKHNSIQSSYSLYRRWEDWEPTWRLMWEFKIKWDIVSKN